MNTFIIAEIGINHNGNLKIAKELIQGAKYAGANAVKFQKRTVDIVYSKDELDKYRESPWGTTNREQKYGLEFNEEQYDEIDSFCKKEGILWFASAWDDQSQLFLRKYNLKFNKIASALTTNKNFLSLVASEKKYTFISTGMCTMQNIKDAVDVFKQNECEFELMHCNSTYPMKNADANLNIIKTLKDEFKCNVGYSGHETGRLVSVVAAVLGASSIERHITLDNSMYGSDQASSLEIEEFKKLIQDILSIKDILGSCEKTILDSEIPIMKKLRKI